MIELKEIKNAQSNYGVAQYEVTGVEDGTCLGDFIYDLNRQKYSGTRHPYGSITVYDGEYGKGYIPKELAMIEIPCDNSIASYRLSDELLSLPIACHSATSERESEWYICYQYPPKIPDSAVNFKNNQFCLLVGDPAICIYPKWCDDLENTYNDPSLGHQCGYVYDVSILPGITPNNANDMLQSPLQLLQQSYTHFNVTLKSKLIENDRTHELRLVVVREYDE